MQRLHLEELQMKFGAVCHSVIQLCISVTGLHMSFVSGYFKSSKFCCDNGGVFAMHVLTVHLQALFF